MNRETEKAKPIPTAAIAVGALLPRQLVAIRWLLEGLETKFVAQRLNTTVQTINRWRRQPVFAAEMWRLNQVMAQTTAGPRQRLASPQRPRVADLDAEDEALVERILSGRNRSSTDFTDCADSETHL